MRRGRIIAFAGVVLLVAACGTGGGGTSPAANSSASPTASAASTSAAQKPYEIGLILPLSGYAGAFGAQLQKGINLAVTDIQSSGGIDGHPLDVITKNSESDTLKAVSLLHSLIDDNHIIALMGPSRSDETNALAPIVAKAGILDMTLSSVLPADSTYTYATAPLPELQASKLVSVLVSKGVKKVGVILSMDLQATTAADVFQAAAASSGIQVVDREGYDSSSTTNFVPILGKLAAAHPDYIVNFGGSGPGIPLVKQYGQAAIKVPFLADTSLMLNGISQFLQGTGAASEGIETLSLPLLAGQSTPSLETFVSLYEKTYQEPFNRGNWFIVQAWDLVHVLAKVISLSGGDPTRFKATIESMPAYTGALATYKYSVSNHGGLTLEDLVVAQVRGGKLVVEK